jgi:serine/threonine protein kinase
MPLAPGTKLGPYEIVAPLGAAGMGEVYRARDTRLERTVAIKILPPHLSDDVTLRLHFDRDRIRFYFEAHARIFYNIKFVMDSGDASDGWRN